MAGHAGTELAEIPNACRGIMIKALIFDFDGLILDTETPYIAVWKEIFAEHGFQYPKEQWSLTVGGWGASTFDPAAELYKLAGAKIDLAAIRRRHEEQSAELILQEPVLPGVKQYLEDGKRLGVRLAIASSSERSWVEPHIARLGLTHYFEKIITGDDVAPGRTKPHADVFEKALSELGLPPREAVVLEDSPNGILAAKAAGLFVVGIPNPSTEQLRMEGADLLLRSLADMPLEDLLRRFAG